jgi:hypothetical protein
MRRVRETGAAKAVAKWKPRSHVSGTDSVPQPREPVVQNMRRRDVVNAVRQQVMAGDNRLHLPGKLRCLR